MLLRPIDTRIKIHIRMMTLISEASGDTVFRNFYFVQTKSGADRALWLGMFGKYGFVHTQEDDPVWHDVMPRKPCGQSVTIEQVPDLVYAINALDPGDRLTIPHLGHLVCMEICEAAARRLKARGAYLELAETDEVIDPTALTDLLLRMKKLLDKGRGRALTAARMKTGVKIGRRKIPLGGKRLAEALKLFPSPEWSVPRLAEHFGMDRMTFLRRIQEATGTQSKSRAQDELAAGNWPPKRKLTR